MSGQHQHDREAPAWHNPLRWIWLPHALVTLGAAGTWLWWMHGGLPGPMETWMRGPGALLLLLSPLIEFAFCTAARVRFSPQQQARRTWTLMASAALSRFLGTLMAQWLPALRLLDSTRGTPDFGDLSWLGQSLSGTVAWVFYGFGLRSALHNYERFQLLPRLPAKLRIALIPFATFVVWQLGVLCLNHPDQLSTVSGWLNWAGDPLLLLALFLSLRLCAASGGWGGGLVGRVWAAYAAGFALMIAGNFGNWLNSMSSLAWIKASPIAWFVWYPAAACLLSGAFGQWHASEVARQASPAAGTRRASRPGH